MADTTQAEVDAQLALTDYRLRVVRGEYIRPEEYRDLLQSLTNGRQSRAKALADASKEKGKARKSAKLQEPIDIRAMFAASLAKDQGEQDATTQAEEEC